MVIGKMTRTCARNSKRSATSTELDNKCPDQLSLLVKKTAVCRIIQIPQAESFDLEVCPRVCDADSCTEGNI